MASKSDTERHQYLNKSFGNTDYTPAATHYLALYTSAPDETGGGTEVTGGSYARVAITNNVTNWPAAAAGEKANGTAATFIQATADWGTVVAWGIHSHITNDALLRFGTVNAGAGQFIASGDQLQFDVGDLVLSED